MEYPNGPTDLRIEEKMRVRKLNQKSVAFEDKRIEAETPLQKEWEEVHFVFRGYQIEPCKTKAQNKKYYQSTIICSQLDHHSHWFCKKCKIMSKEMYLNQNTPCECN